MKCAKDVNISEKVAGAKNYFKRKIKLLGTRKRYVKSTGASKRFVYNLINWTSLPKAIVSKNLTIFLRSKNIGSLIKLLAGLKCLATKTKRFWK